VARIVIPAGGVGWRWHDSRQQSGRLDLPEIKHFAAAPGGENIIGRQFRQWSLVGEVVLISQNPELLKAANRAAVITVQPQRCKNLAESLLSTKEIWGERTIISLGDVVFSEAAIAMIAGTTEPIQFFGFSGSPTRWTEVFAASFSRDAIGRMTEALEKSSNGKRGNLTEVLELIQPMHRSGTWSAPIFQNITDGTFDADWVKSYLEDSEVWGKW